MASSQVSSLVATMILVAIVIVGGTIIFIFSYDGGQLVDFTYKEEIKKIDTSLLPFQVQIEPVFINANPENNENYKFKITTLEDGYLTELYQDVTTLDELNHKFYQDELKHSFKTKFYYYKSKFNPFSGERDRFDLIKPGKLKIYNGSLSATERDCSYLCFYSEYNTLLMTVEPSKKAFVDVSKTIVRNQQIHQYDFNDIDKDGIYDHIFYIDLQFYSDFRDLPIAPKMTVTTPFWEAPENFIPIKEGNE